MIFRRLDDGLRSKNFCCHLGLLMTQIMIEIFVCLKYTTYFQKIHLRNGFWYFSEVKVFLKWSPIYKWKIVLSLTISYTLGFSQTYEPTKIIEHVFRVRCFKIIQKRSFVSITPNIGFEKRKFHSIIFVKNRRLFLLPFAGIIIG